MRRNSQNQTEQEETTQIRMARSGFSKRQYENIAREDWYRFAVKPATAILGIFIVSAILQAIMKISWEPFPIIFTGIGGIPYLVYYYKKELKL